MSAAFYFGKLPSRGDFVKSAGGAAVVQSLDTWVARGLEHLLADADWKDHYDAAPPINFLFGGTRARHFIGGRLVPSHDLSRRRYPLIVGTVAQTDDPLQLLIRTPMAMAHAWSRFAWIQQRALADVDGASTLHDVETLEVDLLPVLMAQRQLRDFTDQHTVDNVESSFRVAGHRFDMRRSVIALGVLLRPMLTQLKPSISKSLILPLPLEQPLAGLVASLWLELLVPFLSRSEMEIGLLMSQPTERPLMCVSFSGADPRALETIWRPDAASDHVIDIRDAGWVDEVLEQDSHLGKLADYLRTPAVSLARAVRIYRETFIGA